MTKSISSRRHCNSRKILHFQPFYPLDFICTRTIAFKLCLHRAKSIRTRKFWRNSIYRCERGAHLNLKRGGVSEVVLVSDQMLCFAWHKSRHQELLPVRRRTHTPAWRWPSSDGLSGWRGNQITERWEVSGRRIKGSKSSSYKLVTYGWSIKRFIADEFAACTVDWFLLFVALCAISDVYSVRKLPRGSRRLSKDTCVGERGSSSSSRDPVSRTLSD